MLLARAIRVTGAGHELWLHRAGRARGGVALRPDAKARWRTVWCSPRSAAPGRRGQRRGCGPGRASGRAGPGVAMSGQPAGSGQATGPAQTAGWPSPRCPVGRGAGWPRCPVGSGAVPRGPLSPQQLAAAAQPMGAAPGGPARGSVNQWARPPAGSPRSPGQQRRRRRPIGAAQRRGRGLNGRGVAPLVAPGNRVSASWAARSPPGAPVPAGGRPRGDNAGMGGGDVSTKASVFPQRVAPSGASPSERPRDCSGPGLCPVDRAQVFREPGGPAGQGSSAAFQGDTRRSGRSDPCTGCCRTARCSRGCGCQGHRGHRGA